MKQKGWTTVHYRLFDIYRDLKHDKPLSEYDKEKLPLYLSISSFKDEEDMMRRIREYFLTTLKQNIDKPSYE